MAIDIAEQAHAELELLKQDNAAQRKTLDELQGIGTGVDADASRSRARQGSDENV
jgi:hypothetical protein